MVERAMMCEAATIAVAAFFVLDINKKELIEENIVFLCKKSLENVLFNKKMIFLRCCCNDSGQ